MLLTPISTAYDRAYGANWPFWRTWTDHAKLRGVSRMMVGLYVQAEGALGGLSSYVIGNGCTYRVCARKGVQAPGPVLLGVQDVIDQFIDKNQLTNTGGATSPDAGSFSDRTLEQELFWRAHRDGEYFTRDFPDEDDGIMVVRTVEPEYVVERLPSANNQAVESLWEYSFGVHTAPDDVQKALGFYVSYTGNQGDAEEVSAAEMDHVKIGVDRAVKRGLPDFVFGTYDLLKTAARAVENMGEATAIHAAIAMIRQHETASPGAITSFQDSIADYQRPNPFNGQNVNTTRAQSGTVYDIPKGMQYVQPPFGQQNTQYSQVVQMILRNVGTKWNAPEWLLSGDASNNNYASSITAESPFVKRCKQFQAFHAGHTRRIVLRALRSYCQVMGGVMAGGRRYGWEELRRLIDVQVEPPSIEVRNRLEAAQESQVYVGMGVKSPQTVQQELGLDSEQEQVNAEEWQERHGQPGGGLPLPADGKEGGEGGKPSTFPQPTTEGLLETKDASGHDHDSKTGEFTGNGGGGKSTAAHKDKEARKEAIQAHRKAKASVKAAHDAVYELPLSDTNRHLTDLAHEMHLEYHKGTSNLKTHAHRAREAQALRLAAQHAASETALEPVDTAAGESTAIEAVKRYRTIAAHALRAEKGFTAAHQFNHPNDRPAPFPGLREGRAGLAGGVLTLPDIRQRTDYTCGRAALESACRALGLDVTPEDFAGLVTTPTDGTDPQTIIDTAEGLGLTVQAGSCTLDQLAALTAAGCPVLCPIQAYGGGHWVVVAGVTAGQVVLHDPASGPLRLEAAEFIRRWHDTGADGTEYNRYGIALWKPREE